ncbi:GNAT family N-acetyltransferase [Spirulina sp. 06S082]|uniref:GNAT family N-acetyltransferase n=1 Tax=Spirulina sp. 06S082 TaxID=3110248 RepID=UPI002B203685|nr:GNAT family N-acetyltransferase [Spirulina sp. 06S082]MEA5468241.1 GNAT family N-acetyltransferase [Spirulina sp. 06S082]
MNSDAISPPEKLSNSHQLENFSCGEEKLDIWLKRRAIKNQESDASRTIVVCNGNNVVGYYCLCASAIKKDEAIGKVKRNIPSPIPTILIGRLAVDKKWQGKGIGKGLLKDAIYKALKASDIIGARAILIHAISEDAKKFYEKYGFQSSPIDPMVLMITIQDARKCFID